MKTESDRRDRRIRTTPAIGFALFMLIGAVQTTNAQWTASGNNISNTNSGNVGIGTTSPATTLHISSASPARGIAQVIGVSGGTGAQVQLTQGGVDDWAFGQPSGVSAFAVWSGRAVGSNGTELFRINSFGNVGIGTTSPAQKLDVRGNAQFYAPYVNFIVQDSGTGYAAASLQSQNGSGGILDVGAEGPAGALLSGTNANDGLVAMRNNHNLHLGTNGVSRLMINTSGNVGIGTTDPAGYKLNVNGNTNVTGNINLTGTINAKYQDVAEWVPASEQLSAGTVVVLDSTKSNQVTSSSVSYDTRVAGVISEQPGIALGEKGDNKVLVATTGRVRVKVDASKGAIHIGDLLVTSDVPGMAMKSEPIMIGKRQIHAPGTLIGKALEPLENGKGEILVLLSLQ